MGSDDAVAKRIAQIYSAISKEMTVSSGDNSWFIKFHNISSRIRKCGALKKFTQSISTRLRNIL